MDVAEHAKKKAATKKHQKSGSVKKDSRGKKASTETKEKEAVLPTAPTAEEEEENRVLASALGANDGGVAADEMETGTDAALPALASVALPALASAATIGEVTETVTEAEDMPGPALATAETEENSAQVQEVPALASDGDVGNGSDRRQRPRRSGRSWTQRPL